MLDVPFLTYISKKKKKKKDSLKFFNGRAESAYFSMLIRQEKKTTLR